jgi:hypothetical protein
MAGDPQMYVKVSANIADLTAAMATARASVEQAGEAARDAGSTWRELSGTLTEVAGAFGLAFSIERSVEFIKQVIEEADQLKNLSLQTRINIEDLQVLQAATREYGVEGDQLGRALFQLQQRIAGGDQSVATALHLMGLRFDDLRDKNPMDLLLTVTHGLGTLSGSIQDTAAKDLFGGKLGASMIAFSTHSDEAIEKAQKLNTIASTESVKAAAEYAEAIDRMTHSLKAWTIELIGSSAQGFNVLTDAVDKGASKWQIAIAMVKDWMASSTATGASTTNLATLLDHLNQHTQSDIELTSKDAEAHREAAKVLDAHGQAAKFMAALQLDVGKPLLDWQRQFLDDLRVMGQLTAQNAAALGVNVDQLKAYEEGIKATTEAEKVYREFEVKSHEIAMKALREEHAEQFKLMQSRNKDIIDAALEIKTIQDQLADEERQRTMSATDYAIFKATEAAEHRIQTFKGVGEQQQVYEDLIRAELAKTVDEIRGSNVTLIGELKEAPEAVTEGYEEASQAFEAGSAEHVREIEQHWHAVGGRGGHVLDARGADAPIGRAGGGLDALLGGRTRAGTVCAAPERQHCSAWCRHRHQRAHHHQWQCPLG